MKLVSQDFDCSVYGVADMDCADTGCKADDARGGDTDLGPDEAVFMMNASAAVTAGPYHVCFSEDGETFSPIPSASSRYLLVEKTASDASHPRGAFHQQRFSARAGATATIAVSGHRMYLPNAASVALVNTTDCLKGDPTNATNGSIIAILTGDSDSSTESSYAFSGEMPADASGDYTVCMCNDPDYEVTGGKKFTTASYPTLPATVQEDLCVAKCQYGCIGSTCFCDGLEDADLDTYSSNQQDGPLCLSGAKCREACDATEGCTGYTAHTTKNRCFLTSDTATTTDDDAYDGWKARTGGTCMYMDDFFGEDAEEEVSRNLGKIYVTQKVQVGVNYVVTPNKPTSLEVTGTNISVAKDRIMLIDCVGSCGITQGTPYASIPADTFGKYVAVNTIIDRPSLAENFPLEADVSAATYSYKTIKNKYCPGNLVPAPAGSLQESHQCFSKCYVNAPCTDEGSCFCDGFFAGHDGPDSSALCLNEQQCEWLCSMTEGCHSIDMHGTKNRCFLNTAVCDTYVDAEPSQLVPSLDYNLRVKVLDENERRLQSHGRELSSAQVRNLLMQDPGISWESLLRFRNLELTSGGEFKLCFCDSDLLGENEVCDGPEDFTIEVGRVHATGLQCLLSNPKMTRGTCTEQLYGGLRCYDDALPEVEVPTDFTSVPHVDLAERSKVAKALVSFCQFAPEDQASEFAFCAQYRTYASAGAVSGAAP
jgi:hypothetical protein